MKLLLVTIHLISFSIFFNFCYGTEAPNVSRQSGKIMGKGKDKINIVLQSPKGGWTLDRMIEIAGTISDPTVNPVTVIINGDRYLLRTTNGQFKRNFPATSGKNSIIVQGTNQAGTFKAERTVYAKVPTLAMMLILTSDTDGVYTDLHVYEPNPEAKSPYQEESKIHIYWAETNSKSGGIFYLNEQGGEYDQPGYGPYLYTHSSPPLGIFRIDTNYWPSGDKGHTVGNLNIVMFGGTPNEIRRTIKCPLAKQGETVTLAWIKIEKGQQARIYSPNNDELPKDNSVWPKWVVDFKPSAAPSGGDYEGD
ncbi:MAG: histidine kinase [Bdellovibrionota bacterium]